MRALKQNCPGAVKSNQEKIEVRRGAFDAHDVAIERWRAIQM
jgi:hypothetical protein